MNSTIRNGGLTVDPVFLGATRPPMRWAVTYSALLFNLMFTMEAFLLTRNLLTLLIALPIHGIAALLCARDARFFDLIVLYARTRLPASIANLRFWTTTSYSPLRLDLVNRRPRHRVHASAQLRTEAPRTCAR